MAAVALLLPAEQSLASRRGPAANLWDAVCQHAAHLLGKAANPLPLTTSRARSYNQVELVLAEQSAGDGGTAAGGRRAAVQQALHTTHKFPDAHQASAAGPNALGSRPDLRGLLARKGGAGPAVRPACRGPVQTAGRAGGLFRLVTSAARRLNRAPSARPLRRTLRSPSCCNWSLASSCRRMCTCATTPRPATPRRPPAAAARAVPHLRPLARATHGEGRAAASSRRAELLAPRHCARQCPAGPSCSSHSSDTAAVQGGAREPTHPKRGSASRLPLAPRCRRHLVSRQHCCKGCQGRVLRSIQVRTREGGAAPGVPALPLGAAAPRGQHSAAQRDVLQRTAPPRLCIL